MADRYAVIGHPVSHSRSPRIHQAFARATGQDIEYIALEAPLDGFARTLDDFRKRGGKGANITLPFKEQALAYCAGGAGKVPSISERALRAGAVNTLSFAGERCSGDNTDGVGLVRDLTGNLGVALRGKRVLLMGAGGAARGAVQSLLDAGIDALVIANRTAGKAHELAARFAGVRGCGYPELRAQSTGAFDVVVNATSAGLKDELPALPEGCFAPGAFAYDMVYGRETPFMALARRCGARVSDGVGMLVEQAAESFRVWRGVMPETAAVLAELRQLGHGGA